MGDSRVTDGATWGTAGLHMGQCEGRQGDRWNDLVTEGTQGVTQGTRREGRQGDTGDDVRDGRVTEGTRREGRQGDTGDDARDRMVTQGTRCAGRQGD